MVWLDGNAVGAAKRAIVGLTGLGNKGSIHFRALSPALKPFGDVFIEDYPEDSFPAAMIVERLATQVKPYEEVCIIGVSLGALLACDLIDELRRIGYEGTIKCIFVHPAHRWGLKLPWRLLLQRPPFEVGVREGDHFREHDRYMRNLAGKKPWRQQFRYMLGHRPPRPEEYIGVEAIVVRSTRTDPMLRRRTANAFIRAFRTVDVRLVSTWHADFVEEPGLWEAAIYFMLRRLLTS